MAWPASWYATNFFFFSLITAFWKKPRRQAQKKNFNQPHTPVSSQPSWVFVDGWGPFQPQRSWLVSSQKDHFPLNKDRYKSGELPLK